MRKLRKSRVFFLLIAVLAFVLLVNLTAIQEFLGINRANTQEKVIALTYDDGPYPPYTDRILEVLDRYQAKGTFFAIGKQIEKHPNLVRLMLQKGEEMANHSYSHQDMLFKSNRFLKEEIEKTDRLLRQQGVTQEIDFRPPWGRRFIGLLTLVAQKHKKLIMWDIDSQDYKDELSAEAIANRVIDRARPGAIVVMHDGGGDRSRTAIATEIILKNLQAKGYTFPTVSELLSQSAR
jgi:peptidoglycan/xylan/chitin deacetylase (PgdA/CDA1 family)